MKKIIRIISVVLFTTAIFSSCGDLQRRVDEQVDKLIKETESLDSLIIKEVEEALPIDSLIDAGSEKVNELDSLLDRSVSGLDSVILERINPTN